MTGTPAAVAAAAGQYNVLYAKRDIETGIGYLMSHSAFVYLIDPGFQWRMTFPFGVDSDAVAADLRYWMERWDED
jgi:protein SCO1/2